jgi:hypothetical protein
MNLPLSQAGVFSIAELFHLVEVRLYLYRL